MKRIQRVMSMPLLAAAATAAALSIGLGTAASAAADTNGVTTPSIGASGSPSGSAGATPIPQPEGIQMSFNLQYLQLQDRMQNENRQYSAVSNILKTKHDTVKNSIDNIR